MLHICKFNLPKIWRSQVFGGFFWKDRCGDTQSQQKHPVSPLATTPKTLIEALLTPLYPCGALKPSENSSGSCLHCN